MKDQDKLSVFQNGSTSLPAPTRDVRAFTKSCFSVAVESFDTKTDGQLRPCQPKIITIINIFVHVCVESD